VPTLWATLRDGSLQEIHADPRGSLMLALKRGGVREIAAICGGCASCGTCHVFIADDWVDRLPPLRREEESVLAFSDWRQPNSRLSCQVPLTEALDGLCLTVAPED
jgi:ferredoxin